MQMHPVPCTVGILTYNSGLSLERCLRSLEGFGEILISDGGSTDNTLEIARAYGCTIIKQSNYGHPINDFSLERNRMVEQAKYDWFFYIDSDEVVSPELRKKLLDISSVPVTHHAYEILYHVVSKDLQTIYQSLKPKYQIRFFNKKAQGHFRKRMHEKFTIDRKKYSVGRIDEPWLVPLDTQLSFAVYKSKVQKRLGIITDNWIFTSRVAFLKGSLAEPIFSVLKQIYDMFALRVKFKSSEVIPLRYSIYRLYSQWLMMKLLWVKHGYKVFRINVIARNSQNVWDRQFSNKNWSYLDDSQPNTLHIAKICTDYLSKGKSKILDLGCGLGSLFAAISNDDLAKYPARNFVGVDFSSEAIAQAKVKGINATFIVDDLEKPEALRELNQVYDVIIANEVLYYCNPLVFLKIYRNFLAKDGVLIISMYNSWRSSMIWPLLSLRLNKISSADIISQKTGKNKWKVKVFKFKGDVEAHKLEK